MDTTLSLSSTAFADGGNIPERYTCDGERQLSPPLLIDGVPDVTKSLALIMDDPDIPQAIKQSRGIDVFDHWTLYNIPPETRSLPEGAIIGTPGLNSAGSE